MAYEHASAARKRVGVALGVAVFAGTAVALAGEPSSGEPPKREVTHWTMPDGRERCGVTGKGGTCTIGCLDGQKPVCEVGDPKGPPICRCEGTPTPGADKEPWWHRGGDGGAATRQLPKEFAVLPDNQTEKDTLPLKPLEEKVSKLIGQEGGSVTSADGLFTVELPKGALKTPIQVSVQRFQAGLGPVVYEVEPDGQPLLKPGHVIMRDQEGGKQKGLLQAPLTQDKQGRWVQQGAVVDSAARTKTVEINHL